MLIVNFTLVPAVTHYTSLYRLLVQLLALLVVQTCIWHFSIINGHHKKISWNLQPASILSQFNYHLESLCCFWRGFVSIQLFFTTWGTQHTNTLYHRNIQTCYAEGGYRTADPDLTKWAGAGVYWMTQLLSSLFPVICCCSWRRSFSLRSISSSSSMLEEYGCHGYEQKPHIGDTASQQELNFLFTRNVSDLAAHWTWLKIANE